MNDGSPGGRSASGPTATSAVAVAESYFQPREPAWFQARLTLRLAVPIDRGARIAAWRVASAAALLAPPVVVTLVAPAARLTASTLIGLFCCALPGIAALLFAASPLREVRRLTARGLRQAGAEHRTAWLIATGRLALFAGGGALAGATGVALLHAPLGTALSRRAPLHGMFGAGLTTWLVAVLQTAALAVAAALAAGSPVWERVDLARLDPLPAAVNRALRRGLERSRTWSRRGRRWFSASRAR